jgi:carbamate kinase
MSSIDVIALGGNAILPVGKAGTIGEQFDVTRITMEQIVDLIRSGRTVVLTHGNGPIVGNIVLRNEAARNIIPPMPLDVCGADSQGGIGYMIQQTLGNALRKNHIEKEVVSLVTQVLVDPADPAFENPVKPIGPYYSKSEASRMAREKGWEIREDSNRGYRRVVPSPEPVDIIEKNVIKEMIAAGIIVITVGGGGIPVALENGVLKGVEAVIDKDRASSVLARELGAERFIILTDVDAVYKQYGTPDAEPMSRLSTGEARNMLAAGAFPPGSMGSKIEAALEFLERGGRTAIIAHPKDLSKAVEYRAGTRIVRDSDHEH